MADQGSVLGQGGIDPVKVARRASPTYAGAMGGRKPPVKSRHAAVRKDFFVEQRNNKF